MTTTQHPEHDEKNEHGGGPNGFAVVVNGEPHEVHDANVTYAEVVELAYPGGLANPDYIFRVDFEHAVSEPHSGKLVEGGHTQVQRAGTEFIVIRSVRS